ncbi:MAG TPA: hypothetical protein VHU87_14920 [Rhizomicrobium sp.]|jgi:uncharacterized membrane protein|nr:hypothetical protein [Rhizomicrobium sp.]
MPKRLDLTSAIFAGFSLLYPLIVIVAMRTVGPGAALAAVLVLLAARLAVPLLRGVPLSLSLALLPVLAGMAAVATFDRALSMRLYPVFMNASMLAAFAATLWKPPSMIERFARVFEPNLPESGVRYTRKVTYVWVGFFALNGAVALWSALQPGWTVWAIYNGVIAYCVAGLLFAGEYLVRRRVRAAS